MSSERPAFGAMLRRLRIEAHLSQEALAERARISVQAVSALERGARRAPQRQTLDLLADALGLDARGKTAFESTAAASAKARIRTGHVEADASPADALPSVPTSFIGREREQHEIAALVTPGRCVTLWGSGGVGKTRLALETARSIADRFPDGIHFVELAPLSENSDVVRATAAAAGAREEAGREIVDTIVRGLAGKRALLILDNAEHVLLGCASLTDRLLRDVPSLPIVVTTREPLRAHGEHVYPVGTLPIPLVDDPNLAASPAVRLFFERATSAGAPPDDTHETVRAIADICTRLDAIPLAIELAAARTPTMSVRQIAGALDDRFRLLTRGTRTASARQKTLYEALDWSYALLSEVERIVLRRLAVWPGTWTLDDAVAVAGERLSSWDVIDAVGALVERSLVVASSPSDGSVRRYSLLQSTEAFALERVLEAGELERGRCLQAERTYALISDGFELWRGPGNAQALLAIDIAPVRAALRWAVKLGMDPHMGAILAGKGTIFWDLHAMQIEALRWLDDALAVLPPDDDLARAEAEFGRARMLGRISHFADAYEAATLAKTYADRTGDPKVRAIALSLLADPACAVGRVDEGRRALAEAMALYEDLRDARGIESVRWQSAWVALRVGDFEEAARLLPSLTKSREVTSPIYFAEGSIALAEAQFALGDPRAAIASAHEGLAAAHDAGSDVMAPLALQNLAGYHLALDEIEQATSFARESLDVSFAQGYDVFTTVALGHLAEIVARRGRYLDAAVLIGYVDRRLLESGTDARGPSEQRGRDRLETWFAREVEPLALARAFAEGTELDEDDAVRYALDLTSDAST